MATSPLPAPAGPRPLRVGVLGPLHVYRMPGRPAHIPTGSTGPAGPAGTEITAKFAPQSLKLTAHLIAHPASSAETLADDLRPHTARRARNNPASAVHRLRATLRAGGPLPEIIATDHRGAYHLDPRHVSTDLWDLREVLATAHRTPENPPGENLDAIAAHYTGPFAEDLTEPWAQRTREALRHDVAEALTRAAHPPRHHPPRHHSPPDGPDRARVGRHDEHLRHHGEHLLDRLHAVWAADPTAQVFAREVMRTQADLGQADDISRTLDLLQARLGLRHDRLDPHTTALAEQLRRHNPTPSRQRPAAVGGAILRRLPVCPPSSKHAASAEQGRTGPAGDEVRG